MMLGLGLLLSVVTVRPTVSLAVDSNYTRRQIKNDQPGFHDFLRHFLTILQKPFPFKS